MTPTNTLASDGPYILFHSYYSICSTQVRYVWALRGQPKDAASQIELQEQNIDLFKRENWTEHFLTEVNPKGQVR